MNVTSKVTGFDFGEFVRKNDFRLLKETRKIYWYGRKGDNQFMSESYLLYRNAKFKMLKKAALKYMLQQINKGLKKHSEEWKISGEIVAQFKDIDYPNYDSIPRFDTDGYLVTDKQEGGDKDD